ncbi:hypothetical protein DL96DRAFT_1579967 [Flagelloscypha sp. PMI_526]|nr:hypothetical protein DL96DRAFT_1579967 [Flagelloscypha sp. PMI_526]
MPSSSSRSRTKHQFPERVDGPADGDGETKEWGDEFGNATRGATGDFGLRSEAPRYAHHYPKRPEGAKKRDGMAPPGWGDEYGNPDMGATGWGDDHMGDFGLSHQGPDRKYADHYPKRPGGPMKRDGMALPGWGDEYGNPDRGATGWGDDHMGDFGLSHEGPDRKYADHYPKRPGGPMKRDGMAPPGWGDEYGNPDRGATGWGDSNNHGMGDFGGTGWDDPNIGMDPNNTGEWSLNGDPDKGATGWGDDCGMAGFGLSGFGDDEMKDFGLSGLSDFHSDETKRERAKKRHIMGVEVSKNK